jgi:hypothetical protein
MANKHSTPDALVNQLALIPKLASDDPLEITRQRAKRLIGRRSRAGIPNIMTREFREVVFRALDELGGSKYLVACAASADPAARQFFWDLVRRTAPTSMMEGMMTGVEQGQLAFQMVVSGEGLGAANADDAIARVLGSDVEGEAERVG